MEKLVCDCGIIPKFCLSENCRATIEKTHRRYNSTLSVKPTRSTYRHKKPLRKALRVSEEIQKFQIYARQIWELKSNKLGEGYCEECGVKLGDFFDPAAHGMCISHILAGSAWKELYYDTDNANLLCILHHQQWEFGEKQAMRIYVKNQQIIKSLKQRSNHFRKNL